MEDREAMWVCYIIMRYYLKIMCSIRPFHVLRTTERDLQNGVPDSLVVHASVIIPRSVLQGLRGPTPGPSQPSESSELCFERALGLGASMEGGARLLIERRAEAEPPPVGERQESYSGRRRKRGARAERS